MDGEGLGVIRIELKGVFERLHSFLDACPGIGGLSARQHYPGHLGQVRDAHGVREIGVLRIGLRRLFQHGDRLGRDVVLAGAELELVDSRLPQDVGNAGGWSFGPKPRRSSSGRPTQSIRCLISSLLFSLVSRFHQPSLVSRRRRGGWMQGGRNFFGGLCAKG